MLQATFDLAGPVAHTMVGWLGTYLLHSTALIGGVWAFSRCFPLDALTRSFLWKVSLVGGLFTASFQTGLGHEPWLGSLAIADDTVAAPAPVAPQPPPPPEQRPCDGCNGELLLIVDAGDGTTVVSLPALAGFHPAPFPPVHATVADLDFPVYLTGAPVLGLPAPTTAPPLAAPAAPPAPRDGAAFLGLAGLFLAGAAFSLARLGLTARRLRRALKGRADVMEGPLRERFDRLMERARISLRQVRLTMSHGIASPLALAGHEIVVPERAEELRPHQQEAMLAHELAHVVRRDPAWQILGSVVEAALWFQPLHRVARRGVQEAAEELSDDWAVRHTGSGVHLARCLAEVASWPDPEASSLASPMAAGGKFLVRRVQRLLDDRERERGLWARRWRGVLGAGLLVAVGLAAPCVSFAAGRPIVAPVVLPDVPDAPPAPVLAHVPEPQPILALADAGAPLLAMVHGDHDEHDHHVVVVESPKELSARQRRLLRRAERLDQRADKLRDRSGVRDPAPVSVIEVRHPSHPHHVIHVQPPRPPRAPQPPRPPTPPRHVRVVHPGVDFDFDFDFDTAAIEAAAEAAEEAARAAAEAAEEIAGAAEAAAEAATAAAKGLERSVTRERVRHLESQVRALAEQLDSGVFDNLDAEIKREIERAMREVERELRGAQREVRDRRGPRRVAFTFGRAPHGMTPEQLRELREGAARAAEAARAAQALRKIGERDEDQDVEDLIDHEALRKLLQEAAREGREVRTIDGDELERIKEIARAAKAREKARREQEKRSLKNK